MCYFETKRLALRRFTIEPENWGTTVVISNIKIYLYLRIIIIKKDRNFAMFETQLILNGEVVPKYVWSIIGKVL